VRIGRRLVLVLLLAMTPVVAVYSYRSARWSSRNYIADLKRETRTITRALAPVVAGYIQRGQWTQVHEMLQRMSADETEGAVLQRNGELWYAVSDLRRRLIVTAARGAVRADGFDFEESVGDRYWFCRIVPLNSGKLIGYLLVAQDWTDIDEDVRQRMLPRSEPRCWRSMLSMRWRQSGGTLTVSTEVKQKDHHIPILKLTFEDKGPGVPPQFQDLLFDPFFTTRPPCKGTGMGLSVSQR
jgi:hypothetical protein